MPTDIRIVIADDHPVFRQGLRQIVEFESGLQVVGEASDGVEALRIIRELKPDIAVLDVKMPRMRGFEVARELQQQNISVSIIFLTMYDDESMFNEALNVGARGYLLKDSASSDIVSSIKLVASGQHYISPSISNYLVNRDTKRKTLNQDSPGLKDLTPTELRVLKLIAQQKTSKVIAEQLFISYSTVENHRHSICQKLDIHTKNGLMMFALEHRSELS
jgi:DNA-binding NarL/FixJ family response regulator